MKKVFLSASLPSPDRDARFFETANFVAIREAISALAEVVLRSGGGLVFGGHPLVSPVVWEVAARTGAEDRVQVYQSELFKKFIPPETRNFTRLIWTPAVNGDREASLLRMRRAMLDDPALVAGVFIGGMEGVIDEFNLFQEAHPQRPTFPIGSTGAAARLIAERAARSGPGLFGPRALEQTRARHSEDIEDALRYDLDYVGLFGRLIRHLLAA